MSIECRYTLSKVRNKYTRTEIENNYMQRFPLLFLQDLILEPHVMMIFRYIHGRPELHSHNVRIGPTQPRHGQGVSSQWLRGQGGPGK